MDWERGYERKRGLEMRDLEKTSFENTKKTALKNTKSRVVEWRDRKNTLRR
jgi:hypothetical protein